MLDVLTINADTIRWSGFRCDRRRGNICRVTGQGAPMHVASDERRSAGSREIGGPTGRPALAVLRFTLGDATFGLAADAVREVTRAVAIVPLPRAPPIAEGVVNVRGELVPVLDIRRRFRRPAAPLDPDQHFIVARAGPRLVALRVDRVTDLILVEHSAITRGDATFPGAEHLHGVATLPDGLIVISDLESFLDLDEGRQVDDALKQAGGAQSAPGGAKRPR